MQDSVRSKFPSLAVKTKPKIIVSIRGGGTKVIKPATELSDPFEVSSNNAAPKAHDGKHSDKPKPRKAAPKFLKSKELAKKNDEVSFVIFSYFARAFHVCYTIVGF